jgi:hypothetical protein
MTGLAPEAVLKLRLLADGIRIDPAAERHWLERYGGPMTLAEYATTSGITLVLPGENYVNAPPHESDTVPALRFDVGQFIVDDGRDSFAVEVMPVPAFHRRTYEDGNQTYPMTNLGVTHTDRCRVSPIEGCAYKCKFCDLPFEFKYRRKDRDKLLELIVLAERDELLPARHVLVSGGAPGRAHEDWLDEVYAFLAENAEMPVDVMMPPRRDLGHPAKMRRAGVNLLSINLEVSDPDRAREIIPEKNRLLGRQHSLDYIEQAVESFGVGGVQSLMVFGATIEPLESTLQGVRDLVDRGCVPVLSAFRPHPSTPLGQMPGATFEEMRTVYEQTLEICLQANHGVLPGPRCIPCQHNTVTFPIDSDFYVGLDGDLTVRCATS